jgi:digeranylgeranylglycerophospholipid reductase
MTPKYQGPGMFRKGNLLIAGDAARSLDSLSGAGIVNAMMSGQAAGKAAARLLSGKIKTEELGQCYPRRFLRMKGEELEGYLKLRKVYANMSDNDFEDIVVILQQYFKKHRPEGIKPARLLTQIIKTRPRLLHLVRYLL